MPIHPDSAKSDLEAAFDYHWRILGQGEREPDRQYKFGRWFIDRAWPRQKVAVELNGGSGGGYGRPIICHNCGARVRATKKDGTPGRELRIPYPSHAGQGAERDAAKTNALQAAGWVILAFTSAQMANDPAACIEQIIRAIHKGQAEQSRKPGPRPSSRPYQLTDREIEVLMLMASGLSSAEIALELKSAINTIYKQSANIRAKMGARSSAHACSMAVAEKLIEIPKK